MSKEKFSDSSQYCFICQLRCVMDHQPNLWLENHSISLHRFYATLNIKFKKKKPFPYCLLPQSISSLSIYKPMTCAQLITAVVSSFQAARDCY